MVGNKMYIADETKKETEKAQRWDIARKNMQPVYKSRCRKPGGGHSLSIFANFSRTGSDWCNGPSSDNVSEYITNNMSHLIARPCDDSERRQTSSVRTLMYRYRRSRAVIEVLMSCQRLLKMFQGHLDC